jgi:hypothetical protein
MGVHGRWIAVSVFAILATQFGSRRAGAEELPVMTTVCDVVANPLKSGGRMIKVRAESIAGRHTSGLIDAGCKGFIPFWGDRHAGAPRWRGQFACATRTPFGSADPSALEWRDSPPKPQSVKFSPDQWLQLFDQALADRHPDNRECMRRSVVATVVGRFNHEPCDPMWVRAKSTELPTLEGTGYGPMNAYHMSVSILSVENVVVGPVNQCWTESERKVQDHVEPW